MRQRSETHVMKSAMKTAAARSRGGIVWNENLEVRTRSREPSPRLGKNDGIIPRTTRPEFARPEERAADSSSSILPPSSQQTRVFDVNKENPTLADKDAVALLTTPLKSVMMPDSPSTVERAENIKRAMHSTPTLPKRLALSPRSTNAPIATPKTPAPDADGSFRVEDLSFNSVGAGSTPGAALSGRRSASRLADSAPRLSPVLSASPTAFHAEIGAADDFFDEGASTGGAFSPTVKNAAAAAAVVAAAAACTPGNKLTHPTPANTPANVFSLHAHPAETPKTAPSESPTREEVEEEVRSWFASVHSKLDAALSAVSPAADRRRSRDAAPAAAMTTTPSNPTPPPSAGYSRFAPASARAPTPIASAILRDSPGTILAPDGAIARLLRGTPTPAKETNIHEVQTTETETIETETIETETIETKPIETETMDDDVPFAVDLLPLSDDLPGFSVAEALPELDAGTLRVVSCVAAAALLSGQSFAIFLFVATCAWNLVSATFSALFSAFFSAFFVEPEPPVVATMRGAYVAYPAALTKFLIAAEAFLARVFRAPFAADIDVEFADVAVERVSVHAAGVVTLEGIGYLALALACVSLAGAGFAAATAEEGRWVKSAARAFDAVDTVAHAWTRRSDAKTGRARMVSPEGRVAAEGTLVRILRISRS